MNIKNPRGFTIIELLVVVAIISVLTGIVLVNVNQYLTRSKNASIDGILKDLYKSAFIYYTDNNTLNGFKSTSTYINAYNAMVKAGATVPKISCNSSSDNCNSNADSSFCLCVHKTPLIPDVPTYCIDSAGNEIHQTNNLCDSICSKAYMGDVLCH